MASFLPVLFSYLLRWRCVRRSSECGQTCVAVSWTYDGSRSSTQVALFEYDVLCRMISSQLRLDADEIAIEQTLKYHYNGQRVEAEFDSDPSPGGTLAQC